MKKYKSKKYLTEELYAKSYLQIAKEQKVDSSTIQKWMRKYNLTKKRNTWTHKEINLLKRVYPKNANIYELFSKRTKSSINHKAAKIGLKRKIRDGSYGIDNNFFKKKNQNTAYVLGWFFSDGNISKNLREASIHLSIKDKEILYLIKKLLKSDAPITEYKDAAVVRINNRIIVEDLISTGCIPKKSLILKFPDITRTQLRHFVRGYFDGDGSIHFNKPNTIKVTFVGTLLFLESLQVKLNNELGLGMHQIYKNRNIYVCRYYGDEARKLCEWMYKGVTENYLHRKKQRFDEHMEKRNE
ncbi:TPA: hypothetical protein HA235_02335 [Candidatus Woesearchaeota archaeon]|nr:hypothetical protein [Candidatus Woesearchaeota archaeon]HIH31522.1 hypothetical protein [Candidatus Woesearchaeota archaeon]HIH54321.1 hypothetical protein [Candidatus Woesearchaeota archaeon]HIJ02490.1 hypothetical protein [Candidatus Woesearchaeota archaeon]HIJ13464.1 hypothetical protein [Candidatus Woesearchaeota archaeon]